MTGFMLFLCLSLPGALAVFNPKLNATFLTRLPSKSAGDSVRNAENRNNLYALLAAKQTSAIGGNKAELHMASPEARNRLMERPPRYVFGVSTGHAGSTSLSSAASYTNDTSEHILFSFEGKGVVDQAWGPDARKQWNAWWATAPSLGEQRREVSDKYKAPIDELLSKSNASTYIDLGHHNVEGILASTPSVFGEDLLLVRFRRSRYPTAFSFSTRTDRFHDNLCNNRWTICPLNNEVLLLPAGAQPVPRRWTADEWDALNAAQQYFWYIDELETEWQGVLAKNPGLSYLECDWKEDLQPCFEAVAAVLGGSPSNHGRGTKQRPHAEKADVADELDYPGLRGQDAAYQKVMNFSDASRKLLARVQF